MYPAEDTITGLIEFDPREARVAIHTRCGSDETLQATLVSLALDLFHSATDVEEIAAAEWNESQIVADVAALESDLLLIYRRVKSR